MTARVSEVRHSQLLSFELHGGEYALPVERVHEVLEYAPVTRVPATPPFVLGVIDHRGRVLPVVDLAAKLGLGEGSITRRSCIVLVEVEVEPGAPLVLAGLLVDAIGGLVEQPGSELSMPPYPHDVAPGGCCRELDRKDGGGPLFLLDLDAAMQVDAVPMDPRLGRAPSYYETEFLQSERRSEQSGGDLSPETR